MDTKLAGREALERIAGALQEVSYTLDYDHETRHFINYVLKDEHGQIVGNVTIHRNL
jgi:hypothetical protein